MIWKESKFDSMERLIKISIIKLRKDFQHVTFKKFLATKLRTKVFIRVLNRNEKIFRTIEKTDLIKT